MVGETYEKGLSVASLAAFKEIARKIISQDENVLIVSHGMTLTVLTASA